MLGVEHTSGACGVNDYGTRFTRLGANALSPRVDYAAIRGCGLGMANAMAFAVSVLLHVRTVCSAINRVAFADFATNAVAAGNDLAFQVLQSERMTGSCGLSRYGLALAVCLVRRSEIAQNPSVLWAI